MTEEVMKKLFSRDEIERRKTLIEDFMALQEGWKADMSENLPAAFALRDSKGTALRILIPGICADSAIIQAFAAIMRLDESVDVPLLLGRISTRLREAAIGKAPIDADTGIYIMAFHFLMDILGHADIDWGFGEGDRINLEMDLLPLLSGGKSEEGEEE